MSIYKDLPNGTDEFLNVLECVATYSRCLNMRKSTFAKVVRRQLKLGNEYPPVPECRLLFDLASLCGSSSLPQSTYHRVWHTNTKSSYKYSIAAA